MAILIFKTLHIIGFVAWFSGLFYLVRMFVNHIEADKRPLPDRDILHEQLAGMETRVYRFICNPAMMFTWICGISMLVLNPAYMQGGWFHLKLSLIIVLTVYHLYCKRLMNKQIAGERPFSSFHLRLLNEVPTLLLIPIAFLGVLKGGINYWYLVTGWGLFALLIYRATVAVRRRREANEKLGYTDTK